MICKNQRYHAYTIVEVLTIVFILSILAVTAIPILSNSAEQQAETEAARLEATIKHGQALASTRNLEFKVVLQVGDNSVTVDRIYPGMIPVIPDEDAYSWKLKYGTIESVDFGGTNKIEFDDQGKVQNGGTIVIDYNGLKITITVSVETGYITISDLI